MAIVGAGELSLAEVGRNAFRLSCSDGIVIPAQAGIQCFLGPRFRGGDD